MSVNGADDFIEIPHSDALQLGWDNGDFTVSFALIQTQELGSEWRNLMHKGNSDGERTFAIWKYYSNTGLHARISTDASGNDGIDASKVMDLNRWYYITYQKKGQKLNVYYDGEKVATDDIGGSVGNDGSIYIGRDPWYNGVTGAGFDNIQIHNRALTDEQIKHTAAGFILLDDSCVLALDFSGGKVDGVFHD
jgi:hypothetical protein